MTKLSSIADEARRVAGEVSESRLRAHGDALRALCEAHWLELRGMEPPDPLAKRLWNARPALADLFLALEAVADPRLEDALGRLSPARGLALLVLTAIERGEAEEARSAYEAMMLYASEAVGIAEARRVSERLHGDGERIDELHRHSSHPSIAKALAAVASAAGRRDLNGVVAAVTFVAERQAGTDAGDDEISRRLLATLAELGVTFLGLDDEGLHYGLRGTERRAVPRAQLARLLAGLGHA